MKEIDLKTWEEFEERITDISSKRAIKKKSTDLSVSSLLFRGEANQNYPQPLSTTLERYTKKKQSLVAYYKTISIAKMEIETFTEKKWDIMKIQNYEEWCKDRSNLFKTHPGYGYMAHLRHHGFPSPLLDWTRTRYIAAYFAFSKIEESVKNVSIYIYCERYGDGKCSQSNKPTIVSYGHNVKSHPRHYRQQSEYTICVVQENSTLYYANHKKVFEKNERQQDVLWKFNIPVTERAKVINLLDRYNLNAFSLFGSEKSLMETIALKELYLRYS